METESEVVIEIEPPDSPLVGCWWWIERPAGTTKWGDAYCFRILEGKGFLPENASTQFDSPNSFDYDAARCGAFADWLEENKDRLLEPHTDLRAEAEERLDSLIKWLRSGFQIPA